MKLLVVIPFCASDLDLTGRLLDWIEELGRVPENDCLLIRDFKLKPDVANPLLKKAEKCFGSAKMISTPFSKPEEGWPLGPNWMFETALRYVVKNGQRSFLWMEPDSVPLRSSWLKEIEEETEQGKKPFCGHVVSPRQPGLPALMMFGIGVYPGDPAHIKDMMRLVVSANMKKKAWDVAMAGYIIQKCTRSKRIYNFHGEPQLPPTFAIKKGPGNERNTLEVDRIPSAACLFHRCKDTTLISILRGDGGPTIPQLCMAFKMKVKIKDPSKLTVDAVEVAPPLYYHAVERHQQPFDREEARILKAVRSWVNLYKTGLMIPCHLWNYPRSSGQIGDSRKLPYLKDVLVEAMTRARKDHDVIVLTNDDSLLHPKIIDALNAKLEKLQCCGSFRVNFEKIESNWQEMEPTLLAEKGKPDLGRDLFAFKKGWLRQHWHQIPDFFLGEYEWDLTVAAMVRQAAGVFTTKVNLHQMQISEIPRGFVLHETHPRRWVSKEFAANPAKLHNKTLALKFYAANGLPSLIQNI